MDSNTTVVLIPTRDTLRPGCRAIERKKLSLGKKALNNHAVLALTLPASEHGQNRRKSCEIASLHRSGRPIIKGVKLFA